MVPKAYPNRDFIINLIYDEFRVSPYDCVHAAVMKKAGIVEIISADKNFDKIDWIRRRDPKLI